MEDWEQVVSGQELTLTEIKNGTYSDFLRSRVDLYAEEQTRRASLAARIDLINQKCQPAPAFDRRGESFQYDRERLGK